MDTLRIPIAAITETGAVVDAAVPTGQLSPEGAEGIPVAEVFVRGLLQYLSGEYLFEGAISGTFDHACDRCLEPMSESFTIEVLWNFQPGMETGTAVEFDDEAFADAVQDDEQLNTFLFEGNEIDLTPHIWEELALTVPAKYLCRPDCAGLCPHCGVDLNRKTCGCPKDEAMTNKGLAGLADLLPQLKPKPPKE